MSRVRKGRVAQKELKIIPNDVQVMIANNTNGGYSYHQGYTSFYLENRGDTEVLRYEELRPLKRALEKFNLVIVNVLTEGYSIMDVANGLRIGQAYEEYFDLVLQIDSESYDDETYIDIEEINAFILEEDDPEVFKKALDSHLYTTIVEQCVSLYREHKLTDYNKMQLVQNSFRLNSDDKNNFWHDLDLEA